MNYSKKQKWCPMIKVTVLGCGSSGGVPRTDGSWGACDASNPKNNRMRCSIKVEKLENDRKTCALIDTSPDLRQQLLQSGTRQIDGVIYTHDHADQSHGIDDLRALVYARGSRIDCFMQNETYETLINRFGYIFAGFEKPHYPALLNPKRLNWTDDFVIKGEAGEIEFQPLKMIHGAVENMGLRFENIAYCNDVNVLPNETLDQMQNLELLIIDALRYTKHPSHAHLEQTLEWIEILKPKKAVLTNMHIDMDYAELSARLPPNTVPAYDMMEIII